MWAERAPRRRVALRRPRPNTAGGAAVPPARYNFHFAHADTSQRSSFSKSPSKVRMRSRANGTRLSPAIASRPSANSSSIVAKPRFGRLASIIVAPATQRPLRLTRTFHAIEWTTKPFCQRTSLWCIPNCASCGMSSRWPSPFRSTHCSATSN